jgi:hypothetical protein
MGLSDIFNKIVGKKKKEYKSPEVTFLDDDITGVTHTIPIKVQAPLQEYIIKHNDEYLVFKSLEEMPEDLRAEIEKIDVEDSFSHSCSVIIDGERKTYNSLDDVPEDIRNAIASK